MTERLLRVSQRFKTLPLLLLAQVQLVPGTLSVVLEGGESLSNREGDTQGTGVL